VAAGAGVPVVSVLVDAIVVWFLAGAAVIFVRVREPVMIRVTPRALPVIPLHALSFPSPHRCCPPGQAQAQRMLMF
jgi:hypothetical protein